MISTRSTKLEVDEGALEREILTDVQTLTMVCVAVDECSGRKWIWLLNALTVKAVPLHIRLRKDG